MHSRQLPTCFGNSCSPGGCGGSRGWTARYVRNNVHWRPMVELFVTEIAENTRFSGYLPFLIDTGAPVTIVPRKLLKAQGFSPDAGQIFKLEGLGGAFVPGRQYMAGLSLTPGHADCETLIFHVPIPLFVADTLDKLKHGLLGLDALRQIVTTFDKSNVHFQYPAEHME